MTPAVSGEGAPHSGHREFLVLLSEASPGEALSVLQERFRVTQVASARLVVVEIAVGEQPPSTSDSGIVAVTGGELPPRSAETLSEAEALFAAAWTSRFTRTRQTSSRRGPVLERTGLRAARPTNDDPPMTTHQ